MPRPEYISEADRREAWNNLQAFCKVFDKIEARHKARLSGNPPGASSSRTSPTHRTGKNISKPVRKTRSKQANFLRETKKD